MFEGLVNRPKTSDYGAAIGCLGTLLGMLFLLVLIGALI